MEESDNSPFSKHYKNLDLGNRATWDEVRTNYRRLVQQWHPDRFENRPRERANAQQNFINVTKAYKALRTFHRINNRLPFQSAHVANSDDATPVDETTARPTSREPLSLDENLLKRDPSMRQNNSALKRKTRAIGWGLAACTLILCTIGFFLVQDRKANQAIAEQGREIMKQTPPSEFMPSAEEIRRSQTRGAFIKPTQ